ncbi:hypothetical protein BC936DRAFT_144766 [Jimgerdemannia flammicorona]|uniref:Three-Cys-motif partner protein TcmP n=1 Tax=Jimgerdemannia flammicorona TaxID=994334 RepID=A0A433DBR0_9FUNG|nr:hypothetical protein BC936DRAFT_144766 [Jimgerdemannia flammicorona]
MSTETFFTNLLAPQGAVKHLILRRYLDAWVAILGQSNYKRLVYIDGFAGAGSYEGDQVGSPLVFLNSWISHKLNARFPTMVVIFIEKNKETRKKLKKEIENYQIDPRLDVKIYKGGFANDLDTVLDELKDLLQGQPIFAFLDPFGYTQIPMSTIKRLFSIGKTEVLVNFMTKGLTRGIYIEVSSNIFPGSINHQGLQKKINALFGNEDDRIQEVHKALKNETDVSGRMEYLATSYEAALKDNTDAKFTLFFVMRGKRNELIYHLVFATSHIKGIECMKEAMFKVDQTSEESDELSFSDYDFLRSDTTTLIRPRDAEIWHKISGDKINQEFSGLTADVEIVKQYVLTNTIFPWQSEIIKHAKPLLIETYDGLRRRGNLYGSKVNIQFAKLGERYPDHAELVVAAKH